MPDMLGLHMISDAVIALAFLSFAFALSYLVKYTDLASESENGQRPDN